MGIRVSAVCVMLAAGWAGASLAGSGAAALLEPKSGSIVKGSVTFEETPAGVRLSAMVSGLTPGQHGFHIHDKGDCSAADATSAGGHFNPTGQPHGAPSAPSHHGGDLLQLEANGEGNATLVEVLAGQTLSGPSGVIGRSVVVHGGKDDYQSQPAGNSGPRVACGVITAN